MASFKGSPCKWGCEGHRAGYNYRKRGGGLPSPYSSSFNNGMRIAQQEMSQSFTQRVLAFLKPRKI